LMTGPAAGPARACEPVLQRAHGLDAHWDCARHAVFGVLDADAPGEDELQDRVAPFLVRRQTPRWFPAGEGGRGLHGLLPRRASRRKRGCDGAPPYAPLLARTTSTCRLAITARDFVARRQRDASTQALGPGEVPMGAADAPVFTASRRLDYELEVGVFIVTGTPLGVPRCPIDAIDDLLFGVCLGERLVRARRCKRGTYQPLGPFLAKNFATTVSPWTRHLRRPGTVPSAAARAARRRSRTAALPRRRRGSPARRRRPVARRLHPQREGCADGGLAPHRVSTSNLQDLYWTLGQIATHHASNGCNLQPGDLLARRHRLGAVQGRPRLPSELTWRGRDPLTLPTGEERRFLEDGDEVNLPRHVPPPGAASIGSANAAGWCSPRCPLLLVQLPPRVELVEVQDRVEHEPYVPCVSPRHIGLFAKTTTCPLSSGTFHHGRALGDLVAVLEQAGHEQAARVAVTQTTRGRPAGGITLSGSASCSSVTGAACHASTFGSSGRGGADRGPALAACPRRRGSAPGGTARAGVGAAPASPPAERVADAHHQPGRRIDRHRLAVAIRDRARGSTRASARGFHCDPARAVEPLAGDCTEIPGVIP